MYKVGDKVIIVNYTTEIFSISHIYFSYSTIMGSSILNPEHRYSLTQSGQLEIFFKGNKKSNYYKASELMSLRELRKLKLQKLNGNM